MGFPTRDPLAYVLPTDGRRRDPTPSDAEAGKADAAGDGQTDPTLCPRCGGKLVSPDSLGWCGNCGYCRSLDDEASGAAAQSSSAQGGKPSPLGAAEFRVAVRHVPSWAWRLMTGIAFIVLICVTGNLVLPPLCLARALWSSLQIVLGIVGVVLAQMTAMMLIGAEEEGLGAKDVIIPGRLWRATLKRLPATRRAVWIGAWSLTAIASALIFLGGFDYWFELLKVDRLRKTAETLAESSEARKKLGNALTPSGAGPAEGRSVQCVVIGYQTDDEDNVSGLLVAAMRSDRLQYAGIVQAGLEPELLKTLSTRLSRLKRSDPLIPGLKVKGVTWVRPGVFCDVNYSGRDKKGQMQDLELNRLLD